MRYDPEKPPAPDIWLALDEDEARQLVARHHRSPRCEHPPAPNRLLHDLMHVMVENHAATPNLPVADALARLVREGLTRHEALHAVGSLLSRYLYQALDREAASPDFDQYYAEVRTLTAESWRQSADPDPSNAFTDLGDDDLLALLFTEEDRLPRAAVDELVVRGPRLLGALIAVVVDPRNWQAPLPDWWAPIHATFILAAIPEPEADAALLSAMREADTRWTDWIIEVMPAILGARGTRLRPTLLQILGNRSEPSGVRCMALDGLVASTFVDPEGRDAILTRVGEVFTAADESDWLREHAGQVLLDLQVRSYEPALMDFARRATEANDAQREHGVPGGLAFSVDDVAHAFREPQDLARYQRPWLDFYDAHAIASRQRRWRREEAERAARRTPQPAQPKVGRNESCPCGSGRKYKKCCLGA